MKLKSLVGLLACLLVAAGCGQKEKKFWGLSGENQAEGQVEVSYMSDIDKMGQADDLQGLRVAISRCQNWGYYNAEAINVVETECLKEDIEVSESTGAAEVICRSTLFTRRYQCLGQGRKSPRPTRP